MHNTIVAWLNRFANNHVLKNTRTGEMIHGVIKIHFDETRMGRTSNCVSFDAIRDYLKAEFERLQREHNLNLSFTEKDLRQAIGSFHLRLGTGSNVHVVMTTPSGRQNLLDIMRAKNAANKRSQQEYLSMFTAMDMTSFTDIPVELQDELLEQATVN